MATTTQLWTAPEALVTALDNTQLASLGNGVISAASTAIITNEADLQEFIELELVLASLIPTGSPYVNVYLVKQIDGSNYEDLTASATHAVIASFPFSTATAAKRVIAANIPIPPCSFKLAVENKAGVAFAASGNTLKYRRYSLKTG